MVVLGYVCHTAGPVVGTSRGVAQEMLQDRELFRTEITAINGDLVRLELIGELDLCAEPEFDRALDAALSHHPRLLVVDTLKADFISVRGFWAIGTASREVEQLRFHARSDFAKRVFEILEFKCESIDAMRGTVDGRDHALNGDSGEASRWLIVS